LEIRRGPSLERNTGGKAQMDELQAFYIALQEKFELNG
jgi:hypothetical protein